MVIDWNRTPNRAARRRMAKAGAKGNDPKGGDPRGGVVAISPAVAAATERLRRAKSEGAKKAYPSAGASDATKAQGLRPVEFVVYDSPDQVVVEFDREVKYFVLSPEKARRFAVVLNQTSDRVESEEVDEAEDENVNTENNNESTDEKE